VQGSRWVEGGQLDASRVRPCRPVALPRSDPRSTSPQPSFVAITKPYTILLLLNTNLGLARYIFPFSPPYSSLLFSRTPETTFTEPQLVLRLTSPPLLNSTLPSNSRVSVSQISPSAHHYQRYKSHLSYYCVSDIACSCLGGWSLSLSPWRPPAQLSSWVNNTSLCNRRTA